MSPIPVILVADPRPRVPSQLLVAIDAVDLTPAVMEWPDVNDPTAYPTFQDYAEATERWLANLCRDLTKRERLTFGTLVGVPGEEIIAAARRADADLIVMGRRGRGRTLPAVLGSTVSVVLRQAPCPVFVVADRPDAIFDAWNEPGARQTTE